MIVDRSQHEEHVCRKLDVFIFADLMATASSLQYKQTPVDCDFCEGTVDVYWRCTFCSTNLCRKCKLIHQTRSAFKDHSVILRKLFSESDFRQIQRIHVKVNIDKHVNCISHVNSSHVWLQYGNQLTLANKNGDILKKLSFDFEPHGFVLQNTGEMLVCDIVDNVVWKILKCGDIVPFINTDPYSPWGICLNKRDEIVLCLKSAIAIYSSDGMNKILEKTLNENQMKWAHRVVQNGNLDYCVMDYNTSSIHSFDTSLTCKWSYKSKHDKASHLLDICCDKFDQVIAGYYYGYIEILDSNGNFIFRVDFGISLPAVCVSADDTGVLWIQRLNPNHNVIDLYSYS